MYVPTNHLYLGDIVICERERATFPDITVEDGIRIFLTGGMALPPAGCAYNPRLLREVQMSVTGSDTPRDGGLSSRCSAFSCARVAARRCRGRHAGAGRPASRRPGAGRAGAHGGEANLVLPDLSTVDFHGINGRTLLMSGLLVCALGLLFGLDDRSRS